MSAEMRSYDEFHDGSFNGLLIEEATAYVFLRTSEGKRYVFVAYEVSALNADEIMQGNIILDVELRPAADITSSEIATRLQQRPPYSSAGIDEKTLRKAQENNLTVLSVDPSYGATCLILAKSFELMAHQDWLAAQS